MKNVFIGAGPANIYCIDELLERGVKGSDILVIEKGKDPYKRLRKEVMNGFLGAGAYSDFKMIYSLTRGGELVKYIGEDRAKEMIPLVKRVVRKYHPRTEKIETSGIVQIDHDLESSVLKNFNILQAESEHIGTDYAIEIGKNIYNNLINKGVK